MKKHIEKIKQKPIEERKKMATIFAGILTGVIVILWIIILTVFKSTEETKKIGDFSQLEQIIETIDYELKDVGTELINQKKDFDNLTLEIENDLQSEQEQNQIENINN